MNPTPLHPLIVHLPLALVFILPVLTLLVALFIKKGQFTPQTWLVIVGLQVFMLGTAYLAMEAGEQEEMLVERVTGKLPIEDHEEMAEMLVAGAVVATALTVVGHLIKPGFRFYMQLGCVLAMLANVWLAWRTGASGGALVYKFGAANAYISAQNLNGEANAASGLLPTPGQNTSESEHPGEDGDDSHEIEHPAAEKVEVEDVEPETPTN